MQVNITLFSEKRQGESIRAGVCIRVNMVSQFEMVLSCNIHVMPLSVMFIWHHYNHPLVSSVILI